MYIDFMLLLAEVSIYVNRAVCECRRKQEAVCLSHVRDIRSVPSIESNEI